MKAESYVYGRDNGNGSFSDGYVGRHPVGSLTKIANPGDEVPDEVVAELGLEDLADHTDYDAILAKAKADGAPITYRDKDGQVKAKVFK